MNNLDHPEQDHASTVPEFAVKRFHIDAEDGSYDMLEVACPRRDCGKSFWVRGSWTAPVEGRVNTRPCPWCFRVSWLPGLKPTPQPEPGRGRRVVKRKRGR